MSESNLPRVTEKLASDKEVFRPMDAALDAEVDAGLAGVDLDKLYASGPSAPVSAGPVDESGKVKRGRILRVGKEDVLVDFGGKSQGVCSVLAFVDLPEPQVGQEMDFQVQKYDAEEGILVLSLKGALSTNVTMENMEVGQVVECVVTGKNKGGLECEVKGMRAFMPAGQVEIYHVPDLATFIGQKFTAEVTKFEREARNIVLSRRNVLEREREANKTKILAELGEGQVRRGVVRSVMDYGAFVDLGGIDGLLHVSEMSFQRARKPSDFVKVGDAVDVKVIRIDKETGKLSLSLRQARGTDPWADASSKYGAGTPVTGRVAKVENFGCFIEVEEGVEGLLPVSEMSYTRIRHPSDMLKEGDTVKLVVLTCDTVARKMSFSLKQAGVDPWKQVHEKYTTDSTVDGKVARVVDFGAFVELEPGLEGLIHISELSDKRVKSPGDVVKPGQEVKVRIMEINADNRRISLSLRRAYGNESASGAAAGSAVGAAAVAGAKPGAPAGKPKDRGLLRGGLDFDYRKNK
jgi:small subunit ribosomal protein S1